MARRFAIHGPKGYFMGYHSDLSIEDFSLPFEEFKRLHDERKKLAWSNFWEGATDVLLWPSIRAAREALKIIVPRGSWKPYSFHEFRFQGRDAPDRLGIAYFHCKDPIEPKQIHPIQSSPRKKR